MPGHQELHRKTDCGRGEHAVRPDHLRAASGRAIFPGFFFRPFVRDEAATAKAHRKRTGSRRTPEPANAERPAFLPWKLILFAALINSVAFTRARDARRHKRTRPAGRPARAGWTALWQFRFSSPSGLAGPAAHETLLLCGCVVGTEVGILLVRLSPSFSWTRGSLSTSDCRHGPSSAPEHAC